MAKRVEVLVKEDGEEAVSTGFTTADAYEAPSEGELRDMLEDSYERNEDGEYVCGECGKGFDFDRGLSVHQSQVH